MLKQAYQDIEDRNNALFRAHARMGQMSIMDLMDTSTMRMKSLEELAAEELIKIRSERIEKQAEESAKTAYAAAAARGVEKAGMPTFAAPMAGAVVSAAPVGETIAQRNGRWLAQLDAAQAGLTKVSDTAIFKQIESAEGIPWDTVKKAVSKAKRDRAERYREGNVKPLAQGRTGKNSTLEGVIHRMVK